eukprot:scaffold132019_cov34-Tisochrysis_lutea.AAC.4
MVWLEITGTPQAQQGLGIGDDVKDSRATHASEAKRALSLTPSQCKEASKPSRSHAHDNRKHEHHHSIIRYDGANEDGDRIDRAEQSE